MNYETLSALVPKAFRTTVGEQVSLAEKQKSQQTKVLETALACFESKKVSKAVRKTTDEWFDGFYGESYRVNARGQADDAVYKKYPELQQYLSRGFTVVRKHDANKSQFGSLVSFRKFYGKSVGDDDDNDYGTSIADDARSFLVTHKANGEMAHVYWLSEHNAWIIGSKNRKILVRDEPDLERYRDRPDYAFSVPIAVEWLAFLKRTDKEKIQDLQEFLARTRLTLTFEIEQEQNQHIVLLEKTRLVLIGLTSICEPSGLHPAVAYAVSRYFGDGGQLACVVDDLQEYSVSSVEEICERVAGEWWHCEGSVLYFLDAKKRVCDMKKVKSRKYVWQRAVREKVRSHLQDRCLARCRERISIRLAQLTESMNWPKDLTMRFEQLALAFADWFFLEKMMENADEAREQFEHRYPVLWKEFFDSQCLKEQKALLDAPLDAFPVVKDVKTALLVLTQGVPGLGKNYVCERLSPLLETKHGLRAVVLAQDDFIEEHGKKAGDACFNHTLQLVFGPNAPDVVILARNNSNMQQYKRYTDATPGRHIVIAAAECTTRSPAVLELCIASVLRRQRDSGSVHPTDSMQKHELAQLPLKFMSSFSPHPLARRVEFLVADAKPKCADWRLFLEPFSKAAKRKKEFTAKLDGSLAMRFQQTIADLDTVAIQERLRRPIDRILEDMEKCVLDALENNGKLPIAHQYIGVVLDRDSQKQLALQVQHLPGTPTASLHVTIVHSADTVDSAENTRLWTSAYDLCGTEHQIVVERYKHSPGHLTAAEAKLSPQLSSLIKRFPHITLALQKGKAVESQEVLKDDSVNWTMLETPLCLSGTVSLC